MKTPSKIPAASLEAATRTRIAKAMAHIERAQNELGNACSELSALCGAHPQWKRASALYDQVHEFWYRVDGLRHSPRVYIDDINVAAMERRLLAAGRDLTAVTAEEAMKALYSRGG